MGFGRAVPNPGKRNPYAVRAKSGVDREIGVLAVNCNGDLAVIVLNLSNHTDSVGGREVSADWPGPP